MSETSRRPPMRTIRLFMLVEALGFFAASLVHASVLITGYEHPQARTAEGVIAAVLIVALALSYVVQQPWSRRLGLAAQGFALLGTLVGLFTIAIGVGPRTVPDLVFHAVIIALLVWGLIVTVRAGAQEGD